MGNPNRKILIFIVSLWSYLACPFPALLGCMNRTFRRETRVLSFLDIPFCASDLHYLFQCKTSKVMFIKSYSILITLLCTHQYFFLILKEIFLNSPTGIFLQQYQSRYHHILQHFARFFKTFKNCLQTVS